MPKKITNLGAAHQFLGIGIQGSDGGEISFCQKAFINSIPKRFCMDVHM